MPDLKEALEAALGESYTIERELGGGGMSRVFLAKDQTLDRPVVVKVLHSEIAAETTTGRFKREVQVGARMQHPHIVPLLSSGEVRGLPFFIMPFIDGESLRDRITREGELPLRDAVRIMRDVASALACAHKHGVIHRDIKPENILLSDDFAMVTDFGIAKALTDSTGPLSQGVLTTRGVALGTPAYMAPEQAAADPSVDHRSDIYSFGVVFYEVLSGAAPFVGRNSQALLASHAMQEPEDILRRRPGIPHPLADLIMRCLAKRPSDRPQNATDLQAVLDTFSISGGTDARPTVTHRSPDQKRSRRNLLAGIGAGVLVAILAISYALVSPRTAEAAPESIAVLPLTNLSGKDEDEYFSEGMTDELANALSKIPNLKVASRASTYAFKGRDNLDLAEVGRKLNVKTVLGGSIRRSGNKLRVSAQLAKVSDGFVLWSNTFEREATDVFKVQDEIASSVADALRSTLAGSAGTLASHARGTRNLGAYDLYLRGRYFWHRRGGENLKRAISYYEAALKEDPDFARAYAGLAITVALFPEYTPYSLEESSRRTEEAANRALSLDSGLAEAHTALGLAYTHSWQREKAAEEYRKALSIDSRYPTANQWYGEYWYQMGQVDSSLAYIRRATSLDPLAPINGSALCYVLTIAGRYDEAIAAAKNGIELEPSLGLNYSMLALAYFAKNDFQAALSAAEKSAALEPQAAARKGLLGLIHGKLGNRNKAKEILDSLLLKSRGQPASPYSLMLAYMGTGEIDSAMKQLEIAVQKHDITLGGYSVTLDPLFASLRTHPRFPVILSRMGLSNAPAAN